MDLIGEERGRLARVAGWLDASPAETLGLVLLLAGGLVATLVLVWGAVGRPVAVPGDGEVAGGEVGALGTAAGEEHAHGEAVGHGHEAGAPGGGAPSADGSAPADGAGHGHGGAPSGGAVGGEVTVHVAGAVTRPGVVTLPAGARVADAIEAAGGVTGDADPSLVNLARPLVDGEQVRVPVEGEDPPPEPAAGQGTSADAGSPGGGSTGGGPIDINHAGTAELETLPGIGPALAQRIVDHRDQHGPFRAPGDLRDVSGIGEKRFQDLADRVTVG